MINFLHEAREISGWIIDIRRRIHRHPELMYEEVETSRLIRKSLDQLQIPYEYPLAETGVVATLGKGTGPCIALRADMDALPIHEEADVPFRSEVENKMHACGHDCHVAMLLGAAKLLKAHEAHLHGPVKFIFQPAEEGGAGADQMCKQGALDGPRVERIFGMHVWPSLKTGTITGASGVILAAAGVFELVVHGKGGHGAMPHLAIDPITCTSKIINELQTIVSRESNPFDPTVVTVGSIHGGIASNVIPESVKITGTYRSLSQLGLENVKRRIEEIARGVAEANRCTVEFFSPFVDYPPVINDADCWSTARRAASTVVGAEHVHTMEPILGGEDFAFYQQRVPGCFAMLGVTHVDSESWYNVHHPKFKVDESALPIGAAWHAQMVFESYHDLKA